MSIVHWVVIAVVVAGIVIALFGWDRYRGSRKIRTRDDGRACGMTPAPVGANTGPKQTATNDHLLGVPA
jgi:hypothetical protein